MSFGDGDLHKRVEELEERIADLEEAVRDLWPRAAFTMTADNRRGWQERLDEMRIEVD